MTREELLKTGGIKALVKNDLEDELLALSSGSATERKQWHELYIDKLGSREMRIPSEASIFSKIVATPIALASIYGKDAIDWLSFIGNAVHGKTNPSLEEVTMWTMGAMGGGTAFGEIPRGALAANGLRVAIRDNTGKIHIGTKGDYHGTLVERAGLSFDDFNHTGEGFATQEGKFLSRQEAIDYLTPTMQDAVKGGAGEVHASDLKKDELFRTPNTPESLAEELDVKFQGKWPDYNLYEFIDPESGANLSVTSLDKLEERVLEARRGKFKKEEKDNNPLELSPEARKLNEMLKQWREEL